MELALTLQNGTSVTVHCDGQRSHTFDLRSLVPDPQVSGRPPQFFDDPVAYGQAVYTALFPPDTPSHQALDRGPERLVLVAATNSLDAVPWEYAHGPDGFIVLDIPFVRGVPTDQRVSPPTIDTGLHIVAVPSNPLDGLY